MERAVSESDVRLNHIEMRLTDVELTSYDGSLLWKVTEVGRRRQQAVSGDAVSVQSPAFYTSRTGQFHTSLPARLVTGNTWRHLLIERK